MTDLRTEIIDGIKLSNNGIGIVNYETLANLPNLNNYVKKGETVGTISDTGTGLQIASNGKLTARNADIKGNFDGIFNGKFGGEVIATKLTLNNVKIPYTNISGTPTLHKVATSGSYHDLSGVPVLHKVATSGSYSDLSGTPSLAPYMKKDGTVYGTISDTGTGIKVESNGKLTARNADIKGSFSGSIANSSINNCTLSGCTINTITKLSGKKGEINLDTGAFNFGLNNFIFNNDAANNNGIFFKIRPIGNDQYCTWMDNTNTLYLRNESGSSYAQTVLSPNNITFTANEGAATYSNKSITFNGSNQEYKIMLVGKNIRIDNPVFLDSYERTQNYANPNWRRPIASVGSDGLSIGYMKAKTSSGGTKQLGIKGQWGKEDSSGNPTSNQGVWDDKLQYINIDSTSDVRLKENIKKSTVSALPIITSMLIREFDWKESKVHQPLGLVADEIEKFDPLLTIGGGYDADGSMNIKSIDRLLLTEYAIKAIQEQQDIINRQQKEIDKLKNILNIN